MNKKCNFELNLFIRIQLLMFMDPIQMNIKIKFVTNLFDMVNMVYLNVIKNLFFNQINLFMKNKLYFIHESVFNLKIFSCGRKH